MNHPDNQNPLQSTTSHTLQKSLQKTNSHNLCDIGDIHIDKSLSPTVRTQKYLSDGHNPYRFLVGGTTINISFNEERSLTSCLARALDAAMK